MIIIKMKQFRNELRHDEDKENIRHKNMKTSTHYIGGECENNNLRVASVLKVD